MMIRCLMHIHVTDFGILYSSSTEELAYEYIVPGTINITLMRTHDGPKKHTRYYTCKYSHLTFQFGCSKSHFLGCGSLPPLIAFPRGLFAEACSFPASPATNGRHRRCLPGRRRSPFSPPIFTRYNCNIRS